MYVDVSQLTNTVFVLLLILRSLTQVNTDTMSNRAYLPVILSFALLFLIEPSLGLYAINVILKNAFSCQQRTSWELGTWF